MRKRSSIAHPAVLATPQAFLREMSRIDQAAAAPGLFDIPTPSDGVEGLTRPEEMVVRAFFQIAEAFGLPQGALAEWHRLVAFDEWPPLDGQLVQLERSMLDDLLLRVRSVAYYHDAEGQGAAWIRFWRRASRLGLQLGKVDAWNALRAQARDLAPPVDKLLLVLETELPHGMASLSELRARLVAQGLTAAGWRWLVHHELPPLEYNPELASRIESIVGIANAMAHAPREACDDVFFREQAVILAFYASLVAADLEYRPWLLASAWRQYQSEHPEDREDFLFGEFVEVGHWVINWGWEADANQRRAGWRAIVRAYELQNDMVTLGSWATPVTLVEKEGLVATAIGNTAELVAEGKAMRHCIASYVNHCINGQLQVFSVRDGEGNRLATFSLQRREPWHCWHYHQMRGKNNADVSLSGPLTAIMVAAMNELAKADPPRRKPGLSRF